YADVTKLGETTGRIIEEYGLPWPIIYPRASQAIPPQPPLMTPTPPPSPAPQSPAPSPGPS
ncbi:MAG TPA: hypothetical protein VET90_01140, partial [Candidatus Binatus sp.]|nr:hypothetical protein [Candidatus Binatus sp.]